MIARNDITGDSIQTKSATPAYRDHYDNIFGKKSKENTMQMRVEENTEDIGRCGCGRSPTGKCIGWHALSEEEFRDELAIYEDKQNKDPK